MASSPQGDLFVQPASTPVPASPEPPALRTDGSPFLLEHPSCPSAPWVVPATPTLFDASDQNSIEARVRDPDDRVVDRLVCELHAEQAPRIGAEDATLRLLLYWRARASAEAHGVAWTPLLDRLSTGWLWPVGEGIVRTGALREAVFPAPPSFWVRRIAGWVRQQSDPRALHDLLRFRTVEVRSLLAREARTLDLDLVDQLSAVAPQHLAANPALDEDLGDHLLDSLLLNAGSIPLADRLEALIHLARRGVVMSPRDFDDLYGSLTSYQRRLHRPALRDLSQFHFQWRRTEQGLPRTR